MRRAIMVGWLVIGCATRGETTDAGQTACATMGAEVDVAACTNACDDDGDGFVDCEDLDCCDVVTCGADTMCGRRATTCDAGCSESGAWACANGIDDDCDGFSDCDDYGCCSSVTCGPDTQCGRRPDAGVRVTMVSACDGAVAPEATLAACSNGCDDDANGFVDCDDRTCCTARTDCPASSYCGRPPICEPPCVSGPENTVATCNDGCSNDGDTFVDCEDRDCCSVRSDCSPSTFCGRSSVDAGPCTSGPENTIAACSDGCSNDGDTFIDCEDRDCCAVRTDCAPTTYCGRN